MSVDMKRYKELVEKDQDGTLTQEDQAQFNRIKGEASTDEVAEALEFAAKRAGEEVDGDRPDTVNGFPTKNPKVARATVTQAAPVRGGDTDATNAKTGSTRK